MLLLLSPAKTLDYAPDRHDVFSQPRLLDHSQKLIKVLRRKEMPELMDLMKISENLATLNAERYQRFSLPFTDENAKQAILAFKGDVYLGLQAETFDSGDLEFAQQHLRILSGLYGLLRPLDLMQAYRLEMGTTLQTQKGRNLYEFWDNKITDLLNADLRELGLDVILNLASKEYFNAVQVDRLRAPVLTCHFKELRNGTYRFITYNAKKARGHLARLVIQNRITDPEAMKELEVDGYRFNPELSEDLEWYFTK